MDPAGLTNHAWMQLEWQVGAIRVQWASFDKLELSSGSIHHMLLLTYMNGFQVWDVEDASNVSEIVSRRDGHVAFLRLQPWPHPKELINGMFNKAHPLLLVVTGDIANRTASIPGGFPGTYTGDGNTSGGLSHQFIPTVIRFYSLKTHVYVHELRFRTGVYAVQCSSQVIAVALASQIHCFDAATLKNTFNVSTYPTPEVGLGVANSGNGAMALGPRWLAYASNQLLMSSIGRVSPQQLGSSPGISPSTSPGSGGYVVQYAKESSKQLAAGVMTLGEKSYKTLSRYCSEYLPDAIGSNCPGRKVNNNGYNVASEYAGTVIVQDVVDKNIVTQFRAHTSPLSSLCFDPSGTLLVTASVYGHNLNVFRLTPPARGHCGSTATGRGNPSHVHLYKLYRGLTNAVIQDIAFSIDSHWIAVSSSRGTSHLFAISPFGGVVCPRTHMTSLSVDGSSGLPFPTPAFPWWHETGPLRAAQQVLPPPPPAMTLSVMARIKNGLGGWRGAVHGDGNTGAGGAVAAGFHDGSGMNSDNSLTGIWKERLWVLSASGHLVRYSLRPSTWTEGGYSSNGMNSESSSSPGQSQDLRLIVEPSEKWHVCRGLNWVEREERLECFACEPSQHEKDSCAAVGAGLVGQRPVKDAEELRCWYMSNAEVHINQSQPYPLWAQPNVFFHVMLDRSLTNADVEEDLHIESTPSRVIEVRRKDLKPVMERFQRTNTTEAVGNATSLQNLTYGYAKLQDALIESSFANIHIRRSSSGSSLGSEGPLGEPSFGMNAFHPYPDSPEVYLAGTLDSSPPLRDDHHGMPSVPAYSMPRQEILGNPDLFDDNSTRAKCCAHGQVNITATNLFIPSSLLETDPGYTSVNLKLSYPCDPLMHSTTTSACSFGLQKKLKNGLSGSEALSTDCWSEQMSCQATRKSELDDGKARADITHSSAGSSHVTGVLNQDVGSSSSRQLHCVGTSDLKPDKFVNKIDMNADSEAANAVRAVENLNFSARLTTSEDGDLEEQDGWEGNMFPLCDED
ncbi:hypothetical protein O6H91_18G001300 [Diphasiastrum complanatum]|uniref:Uncharacterized protein n=1 Tax=Diphasiastrum complanatum TaxID=34168 RepID=A0ACC2AXD2_DIPCM|nr:hypothetical protein O6H91_18G001300 [Diphasiastrum complanatum]